MRRCRRFDLLKWLYDERWCPLSLRVAQTAAKAGHVAIFEWVREQLTIAGAWPADAAETIAHSAGEGGRIHMLQYLSDIDVLSDNYSSALGGAARKGKEQSRTIQLRWVVRSLQATARCLLP